MATSPMGEVVRQLRRAVLLQDDAGPTDGELLGGFLERRDEAAFAALLKRHGQMVWGVCTRVLRHHHDAEDAFQATFLVLVRRAASVVPRERVANWLYGVAHQTALKARASAAKRRRREKWVADMPEPATAEQDPGHDLLRLLDQELSRLPANGRAVIVVCDLGGKTRQEAARQLGLPEGTVASRLARARALLARRLARHGLTVSGGALAAALAQGASSARVPAPVAAATSKAAGLWAAGRVAAAGVIPAQVVALTEGVLKAMALTKLKIAAAVLLAALACGGGTAALPPRAAGQAGAPERAEKHSATVREEEPNQEKEIKKASEVWPEERKRRLLRWKISFDTKDGNDYAKQLEALGATLAVPTERPGKYRVIRDLSKRPVTATVEDLARVRSIFWVEGDPRSARSLSKALGLRPAPRLIFFFPRYIEDELLRKELAFAKRKEVDIEATTFRFYRTRTGFQIKAVSQSLKEGVAEGDG